MTERYIRQIPLIGEEGQKKLRDSVVFIAGAGGLGSPVSIYLAAAGVGTIRIADADCVDESNLNRQILHTVDRIGEKKVLSAKRTLEALNPVCCVEAFDSRIDDSTVAELAGDADLIIDCLDNFEARYCLNRFSQESGVPLLHGAVSGSSGQISLIIPEKTPCLSCIFPHAESAQSPSILGAHAGVVGCLQAVEAIKYLTGRPSLAGKLLLYDGESCSIDIFSMKKNPKCPACGGKE